MYYKIGRALFLINVKLFDASQYMTKKVLHFISKVFQYWWAVLDAGCYSYLQSFRICCFVASFHKVLEVSTQLALSLLLPELLYNEHHKQQEHLAVNQLLYNRPQRSGLLVHLSLRREHNLCLFKAKIWTSILYIYILYTQTHPLHTWSSCLWQ